VSGECETWREGEREREEREEKRSVCVREESGEEGFYVTKETETRDGRERRDFLRQSSRSIKSAENIFGLIDFHHPSLSITEPQPW
jgi:hypothetical protein